MRVIRLWRGLTAPTTEGELARRREAVLLNVLAALVALSLLTQVAQLLRFAVEGELVRLAWWAVNICLGTGFVGMLLTARRGHHRAVAFVLTALMGLLAVLLLLTDGVDKPVWVLLACLEVLLTVILLGGRAAVLAGSLTAITAMVIVGLQQEKVLEPLLPEEAERPTNLGGMLGVVAILGFIGVVLWIYTRDVLTSVDEALTRGSERSPLRRLRTRHLSMREVEVVQLVAEGLSNDAIAARLFVSPRTVQTHVANAMKKTDSKNRTELGVLALRESLVPLDQSQQQPSQSLAGVLAPSASEPVEPEPKSRNR